MIYQIDGGFANTYLIGGQEGLVAVDVGTKLAAEKVTNFVTKELEKNIDELRLVTATHFHIDHVGGISPLLRLCPKAKVHFLFCVGEYIKGKEKIGIPPFHRWIEGLVPTATKINHPLRNYYQAIISGKAGIPLPFFRSLVLLGYQPQYDLRQDVEIVNHPGWRVIETPGHTPDSICLYCEKGRALISGDTILNMEGTGELNKFCCSREDIECSFRKLSALDVENIYPGHGAPIIGIKKALSKVKLLQEVL